MAKKPSITTVASGYQSTTTINSNTQNLRDAFDNTLSLDGSTPNAMLADFDMNSNDIINVDKLYLSGLYIDGQPVAPGTLNYNGVIKETQTATSGQTVFNLTTMVYNPGINSLSVYVDGVYQNPSTYTENNTTRITFSAGLHVGAIVDFVALSINEITGAADATSVTYTPNAQSLYGTSTLTVKSALDQISNEGTGSSKVGFLQSGTSAVNRTVQDKLRDVVSVLDFGADPTGATDSTAAIQAAITYCWSQYVRVFPAGVGLTFPAKAVKLVFPDGIYRITSTIDIATGQYEVIAFEADGIATILWDGGSGSAIRATATSGQGIVTTPISWNGISIRKAGTQKEAGSVAFECERYSNFTVKGMGILGFDIGVWNRGAIDMHYDFDNRAIENCNIGFLTEQKTVSAGIMKPNLLTITNAYFIQCSKFSFWARRNPLDSVVNNGCGSVITIENTNFQGSSAIAVNCEYTGEVPEFGNVAIRNSWFEGAGTRLIRLNRARMLLDNCFIYPQTTGGYPISLETTVVPGLGVSSRITFVNCDTFQYNSQANNTFTHAFTNTDPHTTVDSYLNDVFSTASLVGYVYVTNVAMKAGAGVTHRLYAGQSTLEASYPKFQAPVSEVQASLVYFARGTTASLTGSGGSENIYDMGTNSHVYQVTVRQLDGGIVWRASAEVFYNGASSASVYTKVTNNVTVTTSGTNIVLTNTNPSTQELSWTVQRML